MFKRAYRQVSTLLGSYNLKSSTSSSTKNCMGRNLVSCTEIKSGEQSDAIKLRRIRLFESNLESFVAYEFITVSTSLKLLS